MAEAVDFYDAIEWAAAQPWCNGKVGLSGISYFAINQWFVANLQPPSLKAIIPWEGFADLYRDALFHGGMFERVHDQLVHRAHDASPARPRLARAARRAGQINTLLCWLRNSLDTGALRGAQAQWDKITVPLFTRRQLVRHGAASARQHRSLHARGVASTRSCASTPARTCTRSTPRKAAPISSASSITGSRASTTA